MKKCLSLFLFLIASLLCYSQSYERKIVVGHKTSQEEILKIITTLEKRDTTDMTNEKMSWYHHLLSSCYTWQGNKEKGAKHLFSALNYNETFLCHFTRINVKRDIPESDFLKGVPKETYFANNLKEETIIKFFDHCDKCCNGGFKGDYNKVKILKNEIDSFFLVLHKDDQKYRGINQIKEPLLQALLDEKNRNRLDSLHRVIGFPNKKKVNTESLSTLWMVIHHSTDCDWNKKWLEMVLTEIAEGNIEKGFYYQTVLRFYEKNKGYCENENKAYGKSIRKRFKEIN